MAMSLDEAIREFSNMEVQQNRLGLKRSADESTCMKQWLEELRDFREKESEETWGSSGVAPIHNQVRLEDSYDDRTLVCDTYHHKSTGETATRISIQDSYLDDDAVSGLWSRIKRAINVLFGKPNIYAEVNVNNLEDLNEFLYDVKSSVEKAIE